MQEIVQNERQEPLHSRPNGNGLPMEEDIVPEKEEAVHALLSALDDDVEQPKTKSLKQLTNKKDAQVQKPRVRNLKQLMPEYLYNLAPWVAAHIQARYEVFPPYSRMGCSFGNTVYRF